jgi:ribosomal protein L5
LIKKFGQERHAKQVPSWNKVVQTGAGEAASDGKKIQQAND